MKVSDPNITLMGLSEYSPTFGEAISKVGRHKLCLLCLREIEKDLNGASKLEAPKGRGRGRPQSPATVLANQINVTYDTIRRWTNLEKIQSCDVNAIRLADVAFTLNPDETIEILRQDAVSHRAVIEDWISQSIPLVESGIPDIVAEVEEGA